MPLPRIIYAKCVVGENKLRDSNGQPYGETDIQLRPGEKVLFWIDFVYRVGLTEHPYAIAGSDVLTAMLKKFKDFKGVALTTSSTASWNSVQHRPDVYPAQGKTCFILNCNKAAIRSLFGAHEATAEAALEIEFQTPGDEPTTPVTQRVLIVHDYIQGTEGDPEEPDPTKASTDYVDQSIARFLHIDENGDHWLKDKNGNPVFKVQAS